MREGWPLQRILYFHFDPVLVVITIYGSHEERVAIAAFIKPLSMMPGPWTHEAVYQTYKYVCKCVFECPGGFYDLQCNAIGGVE
jgi:hypothetical protein